MNSITTVTNEATGAITQTTIIHHEIFDYRWFILAMAGFALVAWGLRKIFWSKDSN